MNSETLIPSAYVELEQEFYVSLDERTERVTEIPPASVQFRLEQLCAFGIPE